LTSSSLRWWTYTDRFGQTLHHRGHQLPRAAGHERLRLRDSYRKTFTTGATINNPNEVLLNTADGEYYKWTGSFASGPKVVPANSTPASTGGIAPGRGLVLVMRHCVLRLQR
jgi:hypothetical protein